MDEYAQRHSKDSAAALDDALAACREWERQDFGEAAEAIRHGIEEVRSGRTRPAIEFLAEMRQKHRIPR